jgi:hypothetical protein
MPPGLEFRKCAHDNCGKMFETKKTTTRIYCDDDCGKAQRVIKETERQRRLRAEEPDLKGFRTEKDIQELYKEIGYTPLHGVGNPVNNVIEIIGVRS